MLANRSPHEYGNSPEFRKTNYVTSGVWALAFALMVLAELAILRAPQMPRRVGGIVTVLAIVGALRFTGWCPARTKNACRNGADQGIGSKGAVFRQSELNSRSRFTSSRDGNQLPSHRPPSCTCPASSCRTICRRAHGRPSCRY